MAGGLWYFGPFDGPVFSSTAALAAEIGCKRSPFPADDKDSAILRQVGVESSLCHLDDEHVLVLSVFESRSDERTVVRLMRERVNVEPAYLVVGDRFVVQSRTYLLARQVRDAVGGEVMQT